MDVDSLRVSFSINGFVKMLTAPVQLGFKENPQDKHRFVGAP